MAEEKIGLDLPAIRTNLIEKRDELERRVSGIKKDFKTGRSADSEDRAVENENNDVLDRLKEEAETELFLISLSLQRLDSGFYGICAECGKSINSQRLNAVPHTTICIHCAK